MEQTDKEKIEDLLELTKRQGEIIEQNNKILKGEQRAKRIKFFIKLTIILTVAFFGYRFFIANSAEIFLVWDQVQTLTIQTRDQLILLGSQIQQITDTIGQINQSIQGFGGGE